MSWFRHRRPRGRPPHPDILTPAEWRVLEHVRDGMPNAEIAIRLGVSINTVRTHVSSMLAKLELRDRAELARWAGEPSGASQRLLARLRFAMPLGWLSGRGGHVATAGKAVAIGAVAVVAAGAVVVAVAAGRDGGGEPPAQVAASPTEAPDTVGVAPTPEATAEPTAPPTPVPTLPAGPPFRSTFERGEPIDVSPAVVFVDTDTGRAEAWVIPGAMPEFGVAPSGKYIVYQMGQDEFRLLRTEDGRDRAIRADSLPIEYGPGDSGFVATTQGQFVVSRFDGFGEHTGELWLGGVSSRTAVAWAPDGEAIATAIYPGGGRVLSLTIRLPSVPARFDIEVGASSGRPSLAWSWNSARIAVATHDRVRVFSRDGDLLWEYEGDFYGNPRWSPDDRYLYLNAMPLSGGDVAYFFSADGEPLFRFVSPSYAGGCGGDPWVGVGVIEFAEYDVQVDGSFQQHGRPSRLGAPAFDDYGIALAEGIGFHIPHYGAEANRTHTRSTDDGRLVFTTGEVGHGGCGLAMQPSDLTQPVVERPPYDPLPTPAAAH